MFNHHKLIARAVQIIHARYASCHTLYLPLVLQHVTAWATSATCVVPCMLPASATMHVRIRSNYIYTFYIYTVCIFKHVLAQALSVWRPSFVLLSSVMTSTICSMLYSWILILMDCDTHGL